VRRQPRERERRRATRCCERSPPHDPLDDMTGALEDRLAAARRVLASVLMPVALISVA